MHHAVARIISDKPELLQCARVVAWLEELASDALAYSAEQNLGDLQLTPIRLACILEHSMHLLRLACRHFIACTQNMSSNLPSVT